MKNNALAGRWIKRIAVYLLGVVTMAVGISLAIRAGIGVAPGGVISYAVSRLTVISVGWCTTLFHIVCIFAQLLISRRFTVGLVIQLPLAFVFGRLIDFFLGIFAISPANLIVSIAILCGGIIVFSFGIRAMAGADLLLLPSDGLAQIAGAKVGWKFPKAKLVEDILFTVTAVALMLAFSGDVFSVVGIGTVLSAAATGPMVGVFTRLMPFLDVSFELKRTNGG